MYIGCHLSAAKGYAHMGKDALSIGANTFQFFTRNPRGARAKALDPDDMRALLEAYERKRLRHNRRARAIHAQRLFIGSASAGACPRHDRRRPGADGASAGQSL